MSRRLSSLNFSISMHRRSLINQSITYFFANIPAIATGTVIYVIFFEIFPKAKEIGGTGFQHVISMIAGFAIFLPSLLFRKYILSNIIFMILPSPKNSILWNCYLPLLPDSHDDGEHDHDHGDMTNVMTSPIIWSHSVFE